MEVCNLNKTKKYLDNVQKFLDYTDNIEDDELRENIRNSIKKLNKFKNYN
jgi:hypothetical protein